MKTKRGLANSKQAAKHVVENKLVWTTPEDYRRIILLKENQLHISEEILPGNISKQYDIFCSSLGIW